MYIGSKTSLWMNYRTQRNASLIKSNQGYLRTSYKPRTTEHKKRILTLANIEDKYKLIQNTVNDPKSIYSRSKSQALRYKGIQYRLLYKAWRNYHDKNNNTNELTLFHDHFAYLRKNVYPFTLIHHTEDIEDWKRRPQTVIARRKVSSTITNRPKTKITSTKARVNTNRKLI